MKNTTKNKIKNFWKQEFVNDAKFLALLISIGLMFKALTYIKVLLPK